ncbi:EAL domain-containing protein [Amycolatopsis taiwanensis]|uniref:EAL domain-containing protein n=1 Tax=Amycolatopsis taiwanensis TaxID=342230 RepID=UPI002555F14B|nr:EAL domain-containing protein [Amycolatopsis taiwanensis]
MAEPGRTPGLAEIVGRWVARLARPDGTRLSPGELEDVLTKVAQEAAGAAPRAAASRFGALFSRSPIGMVLADQDGEIVEVNVAMTKFLGRPANDLRGREIADLGFAERDAETLRAGLAELATTGADHYRERIELAHSDGASVWAEVTLTYLPGDRPGSVFPMLMAVDENELHALQETFRRQSVGDPLTGLSNALSFHTKLEAAFGAGARDQVALIYLDIDGFRVINDGLGPGVADQVLRGVAGKLTNAFAAHDPLIARLSGDGFAVLLRGELTRGEVIGMVEAAMDELNEPIYLGEHGVGVSVSAGIVVQDVSVGGHEEIQRAAELALHRAKEAGRAQWMLFDPEADARDRARFRLGAELAGALENGQFKLHYFPVVRLDDHNDVAAVAARLRWHHPELGALSTRDFGPLAEATGLIPQLGKWVVSEVIATAARWREAFGSRAPGVSLPLPRRMAADPDLVRLVRTQLDRHDLPAEVLSLRTDSDTIVDEDGDLQESLAVLAELGAKPLLAVRGSADLELIARHALPVRQVVLGRTVVAPFAEDKPDAAAIRHLDHLMTRAAELNLRVGAAGIRSAEEAARLHEFGVLAGYGPFAGSATQDEIEEFLRNLLG